MSAMASQITSLRIVYTTVYSGTDQRKHQSSASLAFVRGISRTKGRWRGKCFHLMTSWQKNTVKFTAVQKLIEVYATIIFTQAKMCLIGSFLRSPLWDSEWWATYHHNHTRKSIANQTTHVSRDPFQYPIKSIIVRSRDVWKPRDLYLELFDCSEMWQEYRQPMCLSNLGGTSSALSNCLEIWRAFRQHGCRESNAEPCAKFQSDMTVSTPKLAGARLCEVFW